MARKRTTKDNEGIMAPKAGADGPQNKENTLVDHVENVEEERGADEAEVVAVETKKITRNPSSMWKIIAARSRWKKVKVRYDGLGRALYEDNKALQSYIGHVARSMVPINIDNWRLVQKDIKDKIWEEINNVFEVAPQTQKTVLSSAAQKWRDWKTKMTKKYVWPHRKEPELLRSSPPEEYQISLQQWREFVDKRLDPLWKITHKVQKARTKKLKYRHKLSRKGYCGLEAELRKKKLLLDDEEIGRSLLWILARQDAEGKINDEETKAMATTIEGVLQDQANGKFKPEGMHDALTKALGTDEKYGRVRGVGGFVKPQVFFGTARKTREPVSKVLVESLKEKTEEANSLKAEVEKLRAELAAEKESNGKASSSKKSSNMKDNLNKEEQMEVVESDAIFSKGKKCKLVDGQMEAGCEVNSEGLKRKKTNVVVKKDEVATDPLKMKRKKTKLDLTIPAADPSPLGGFKTQGKRSSLPLSEKEIEAEAPKTKGAKTHMDMCDKSEVAVEGRQCTLALGTIDNIVAYGTVVSVGGPNVFIHTVPLAKGNWKVVVDGIIDDTIDEDLPVLINNEPLTVSEAVGAIVAWPMDLVIITKTRSKLESPVKPGDLSSDLHNDVDDRVMIKENEKAPKANIDASVARSKIKEIDKLLPISCKYLYAHAEKLMDDTKHMRIDLDEAMFGESKTTWLSRNYIFDFMEMQPIGGPQILTYMGKLFSYLKETKRELSFCFVDPGCVPKEGDKDANSKNIIKRLSACPRDNICLIPYNTGSHWILTVVNDTKDMVYLLDSMGNRTRNDAWKNTAVSAVKSYNATRNITKAPGFKQLMGNWKQRLNTLECGYCVLRYMKEIVECEDPQFDKMFAGSVKDQF